MAPAYEDTPIYLGDAEEFVLLADLLEMPESERRSVLAMSPAQWNAWVRGAGEPIGAEQRRRLNYAMDMMRRAVANLVGATV